ncbi:MAG: acyltransferase [Caulobacteraceae bacterium]|nr:acyltransferase [Caulobacteraceae bacterium]
MTAQNASVAVAVKDRGGPLEALRFLAAAFIVLYHVGIEAPVRLGEVSPIFTRGWLATDFFLMLSGFILGRAYGRSLDSGRVTPLEFFKRRLLRVWPGQVIVLFGFLMLLLATSAVGIAPRHPENFTVGEFFQQLFLVHAWGFSPTLGWNQPSWSLSVLVACYALFAPFWIATRRLGTLTALLAAPLVVALSALGVQLLFGESMYDLRASVGLFRGVPLFFAGVLLSRASADLKLSPGMAPGLLTAAAAALALTQMVERNDFTAFGAVMAIGAVIIAADAWKGSSRLAYTGARISYSLYITSSLVGAVWFGLIRMIEARYELGAGWHWALWAGVIPAAVGFAWVYDRFVDGPLQRWIKARRGARRQAVTEALAA